MRITRARAVLAWLMLVLAGSGLLGLLAAPRLPLYHQLARQQWLHSAPQHYELDALWSSGGWSVRAHLEVRDGQIVDAIDLRSGRRLDPIELGMLGHMFPIERTFAQIDALQQWPVDWRSLLARLLPWWLARRIEPCSTPPPRVRYDYQFGHPVAIDAFTNPCFNGVGFHVRIDQLRPLP